MLSFSLEQFKKLRPLELKREIICSEAQMFEYCGQDNVDKIIKKFYHEDEGFMGSKIYTCNLLRGFKDLFDSHFCIPEKLLRVEDKVSGLVLPKIEGENLTSILNNPDISFQEKKELLAKLGELLNRIQIIRRYPSLKDFFVGDLNTSNCMVDKDGNIILIDMDSCKLMDNETPVSKHLVTNPLIFSIHGKYKSDPKQSHLTEINENTDLFCYNMILFEFMFGRFQTIDSLTSFQKYVDIMKTYNVDSHIVKSFERLYSLEGNINPFDYVPSLSEEQVMECRSKVKKR